MENKKKVLMLTSSPKPEKSTSAWIEGREVLVEAFQQADSIFLTAPLYVDSLPAPVIRLLELIAENRIESSVEQSLMAIINAGFPEAVHNETALAICENFARENDLKWAGGLPIGMGGVISGAPLEKLDGMVHRLTGALDLAAEAILKEEALTEETKKMATTPFMPPWLYRCMGNIGWKMQARKFSVGNKINNRPDV